MINIWYIHLWETRVRIAYIFICFGVCLQRCLFLIDSSAISEMFCDVSVSSFFWCLLFLLSLDWHYRRGVAHTQSNNWTEITMSWRTHLRASKQKPPASYCCQSPLIQKSLIKSKLRSLPANNCKKQGISLCSCYLHATAGAIRRLQAALSAGDLGVL